MKTSQRNRQRILQDIRSYFRMLKFYEWGMLGVVPVGWSASDWMCKGLKGRDNARSALFELLEELDSSPYEGEDALSMD